MSEMKLNLVKRDEKGKNKVDKLRENQMIPGVIYSKGNEAMPISALEKDLIKVYHHAGTSNIVSVNIDGNEQKIIFKEIQKHHYKNRILHFDMYLIDMSEKIRVSIPVVLEGRDSIKVQPSVLLQLIDEIEIECLPGNLPSEAIVNVEDLNYGDSVTIADLDIAKDNDITFTIDPSEPVATLQEPREEEMSDKPDEIVEADIDVPTVAETNEEE
ncbi:MAG: 50S ribosomal protein L25 [Peptoniphilaceae bacterium]